MSGAKKLRALFAALAVLFLLNSCTDFFSTTWGEMFKRDPKKVRVTSSNVYDLLDTAKGDPELSRAILDKINADSDDELKRAAIKAANQASGLTTAVMENVEALIDAIDTKGDKEAALKEVAKQIINNIRDNDVEGIGAEVTEILKDKIETNLPVPSKQPKDALIKAEKITVSVPKAGSAGTGTVTVTINNKDTGGGTIVVNGTSYPCVINDDGTITLTGAGNNGGTVVIGSIIDDDDRTVTLTNLDKIANAGLEGASNPSPKNSIPHGKPEFEDGFIDDSISESDLTLLVMTLILAKIEKVERVEHRSLDEYLTDWTREDTTKDVKTGAGLDDDELLIASIVNFMIDRGDDMSKLTNMIKDLLGVK